VSIDAKEAILLNATMKNKWIFCVFVYLYF